MITGRCYSGGGRQRLVGLAAPYGIYQYVGDDTAQGTHQFIIGHQPTSIDARANARRGNPFGRNAARVDRIDSRARRRRGGNRCRRAPPLGDRQAAKVGTAEQLSHRLEFLAHHELDHAGTGAEKATGLAGLGRLLGRSVLNSHPVSSSTASRPYHLPRGAAVRSGKQRGVVTPCWRCQRPD
jgi:hypothetical protein